MLVLIRRAGEQIFINKGQIVVKVLKERNGNVYVGIKAPRHITVDREEVFISKQEDDLRNQ